MVRSARIEVTWERKLDEKSKAERKTWVVYGAYVFTWFCYLFILRSLNTQTRPVSTWLLVSIAAATVYSGVVGFVMRRKFFVIAAEGVGADSAAVIRRRWLGNITGFSCATTIALLGFALKILGSSWLAPGVLFGAGLALLLLWRPRPLP